MTSMPPGGLLGANRFLASVFSQKPPIFAAIISSFLRAIISSFLRGRGGDATSVLTLLGSPGGVITVAVGVGPSRPRLGSQMGGDDPQAQPP